MRQAGLIFIFIVLLGCTQKTPSYQEKKNADTINVVDWICGNATRPIEKLIPCVLNGYTDAYDELYTAYMDIDMPSFLPYALLMANKYDYTMAYYDVYSCLTSLYWNGLDSSISLDSLDNQTRMMALEYLKKAADKGERNASWELGRLCLEGKHVKKDTVLGNQLLAVP